jgi:ABC-2 type transport system ATP-binding protein
MIEVVGLVKRYGDRAALTGVTFKVERGEIVGFLGPNGAGKTTTLRILSTFLTQDAGEARVAGFDVLRAPMEVRRRLGYLPEQPPLDLDHTVREYLGFCAALRGVRRKSRGAAIGSVVERCGLASVADRLIGNLSKGFRQRVGLFRSLAGDHTVLLSSHILPEVAMTCSRVVVVHRGRVAADVPVDASAAGQGLEDTFLRVTAADVAAADEAAS